MASSLTMDPEYSLQDVIRCHSCETSIPTLHCALCNKSMCNVCVGEHLSDESKNHKVVSYKKREPTAIYPECTTHSTENCELFCEQCHIPICVKCASSYEHKGHVFVAITQEIKSKRQSLEKDLKELEKFVYPKYLKLGKYIPDQKAKHFMHFQQLLKSINKHGENLHKEIDINLEKLKSNLNEMTFKFNNVLEIHEKKIMQIISEIEQSIADLRNVLKSNDAGVLPTYKSEIARFGRLLPKITISLPVFTPYTINKENIFRQFGCLSELDIRTEEYCYPMDEPSAENNFTYKPIIDDFRVITDIDTDYGNTDGLLSVFCLSDELIWTCGSGIDMRLYNHQGEIIKSIHTKSGRQPWDITVTRNGDLVYTDPLDRTVNIVKNRHIQEVIRLYDWTPLNVCSTSSDDLLVTMFSNKGNQTKLVRYTGSIIKQIIQFDESGNSLYSSDGMFNTTHVSENRNLDICVADSYGGAIIVVNQAGKLKFVYSGPPFAVRGSFNPVGLTTDSHGQILTADYYNDCIHILDQNGQLICYIDYCDLHGPMGLCVDNNDSLFVAESDTGKVRKIQYCITEI